MATAEQPKPKSYYRTVKEMQLANTLVTWSCG